MTYLQLQIPKTVDAAATVEVVTQSSIDVGTPMNWQLLVPLLITTVLAIFGWVVGHRFNVARDRMAKHRELRLNFLINAYRGLENFAGRNPPFDEKDVREFEMAFADIQLLGSQAQIDKLEAAFSEKRASGESDLNTVINELRSELRRELDLPQLSKNVTWMRLDRERIKSAL